MLMHVIGLLRSLKEQTTTNILASSLPKIEENVVGVVTQSSARLLQGHKGTEFQIFSVPIAVNVL